MTTPSGFSPDLSPVVPVSVDEAGAAVASAWRALCEAPPAGRVRAAWLEAVAAALDGAREQILAVCARDTALTIDELAPEFARMTGVLRLMAEGAADPASVRPAIDLRAPQVIGPGHDVRGMLVPLGPVAVFGASNFPLAYGVCGGDTASALAAGCPVVVKEHPAHPAAGRLIAGLAGRAMHAAGAPSGLFTYVAHEQPQDYTIPEALVAHPAIRAVGFTGSQQGGLALERAARARPAPIPVFAEMGSLNPVLITPGAAAARAAAIGEQLSAAVLLRHGQQCTCPGAILCAGGSACNELRDSLASAFAKAPGRRMLAPWIARAYARGVQESLAAGAELLARGGGGVQGLGSSGSSGDETAPCLLGASVDQFMAQPRLREEVFGPSVLLVTLADWSDLERLELPGSLTLTLHLQEGEPAELEMARRALTRHGGCAGRVVINGVPTGVRACGAMVHGGPFPSTNRPDTTAVGPRAMERWLRPVCWQNALAALLPAGLR